LYKSSVQLRFYIERKMDDDTKMPTKKFIFYLKIGVSGVLL